MPTSKVCPECKKVFECVNDSENCWCAKLPNVIPLAEGAECLCEECLKKKISDFESRIAN